MFDLLYYVEKWCKQWLKNGSHFYIMTGTVRGNMKRRTRYLMRNETRFYTSISLSQYIQHCTLKINLPYVCFNHVQGILVCFKYVRLYNHVISNYHFFSEMIWNIWTTNLWLYIFIQWSGQRERIHWSSQRADVPQGGWKDGETRTMKIMLTETV